MHHRGIVVLLVGINSQGAMEHHLHNSYMDRDKGHPQGMASHRVMGNLVMVSHHRQARAMDNLHLLRDMASQPEDKDTMFMVSQELNLHLGVLRDMDKPHHIVSSSLMEDISKLGDLDNSLEDMVEFQHLPQESAQNYGDGFR